jgi:hypothetical protein
VYVVCVPAADTTSQVVKVTCEQFTDDFSVFLTATAGSVVDCQAAANATADVTVNTRPTVGVAALANATVCLIPGNTTSQELLFTVSSSGGDATVTPIVTGDANCTAEPSTVSE